MSRHTDRGLDSGLHHIPPFEGIQVAPSRSPEAIRPPGDGLHGIPTEIDLEPARSSSVTAEKAVRQDQRVERKRRLSPLAVTVTASASATSSLLGTIPSPTSASKSTSSASKTSSKSSASINATPTTIVECPKVNGTIHTSFTGQNFRIRCGVDVTDGPDLLAILEYTVEDCIDACGNYNSESSTCQAVTFNANLTSSIPGRDGNCFLKASSNGVSTNGADPVLVASAFLLDST
ncbi:MAG: hypothetical protein Q9195_009151 [Heterodermia aff. obscurata]